MKRLANTQVLREGVFNRGSNLRLYEFFAALFVGGLCLLLAASSGFAQGIVTGSIAGTVQDQQGAVIAGATVNAVGVATGTKFSSKSDSQGYFEFKGLPIGSYSLTIEGPGFRKLQVSEVVVVAGKNNVLPTQTLEVGSASETVTVEATTPLIDSTSSQIGGNFDSKIVGSLPNAGTGFDNLVLFVPGVANNGSTNFSNTNGAAIANNGLRGRSNNFQIDGQANNDNSVAGPLVFLSNPDILGELQVVSNNFSAEYGRNSGTVVNYITKSGSNAFHGSGYEYYEGDWDRSLANGQKSVLQGFCPPGVAAGQPMPVNMAYFGGKVQVTPKIYLVLWGWGEAGAFNHTNAGLPANDPDGVAALMTRFIAAIGGTSWGNISTQYYQSNYNGTFSNVGNPKQELAGVWHDDTTPIHNNMSPLELAQEAGRAAQHFGVTNLTNANLVVATPQMYNDAGFNQGSYCAWHDYVTPISYPGVTTGMAFTNMPYVLNAGGGCGQEFVNPAPAGNNDGVTIVLGHEIAETLTDPGAEESAGQVQNGAWSDYQGWEIGDKCAWVGNGLQIPGSPFNMVGNDGRTYPVQTLWNNQALSGAGYCTQN